jgi:hypothetical protein
MTGKRPFAVGDGLRTVAWEEFSVDIVGLPTMVMFYFVDICRRAFLTTIQVSELREAQGINTRSLQGDEAARTFAALSGPPPIDYDFVHDGKLTQYVATFTRAQWDSMSLADRRAWRAACPAIHVLADPLGGGSMMADIKGFDDLDAIGDWLDIKRAVFARGEFVSLHKPFHTHSLGRLCFAPQPHQPSFAHAPNNHQGIFACY